MDKDVSRLLTGGGVWILNRHSDVIVAHSSTKLRLNLQKSSTKFLFPKTANQRILKLFLAEIKSNFD